MCPKIGPAPSLLAVSLIQGQGDWVWLVVGVGCLVGIVGVRYTWRAQPEVSTRHRDAVLLATFLVAFLGGIVLVIEVANPWGSALLSWYLGVKQALEMHSCATAAVAHTYAHLHATEDWLRVAGAILSNGSYFAYFISTRLLEWLARRRQHMSSDAERA